MKNSPFSKHLRWLTPIAVLLAVTSLIITQSIGQALESYSLQLPLVMRQYSSSTTPVRALLSEIHIDPTGSEPAAEWIEIYNPGGFAMNLSGYKVGDASAFGNATEGMLVFPAGASIPPGETVVIANQATAFQAAHGFKPDYEMVETDAAVPNLAPDSSGWASGTVNLNNAGDEVALLTPQNVIADSISWGTSTVFFDPPAPQPAEGSTLEHYPPYQDTNSAGDWREQAAPSPESIDATPAVLTGMHWFAGQCFETNPSIPFGQRGWNVESIWEPDDSANVNFTFENARAALNAGLVNIIRIDYHGGQPVPKNANDYPAWGDRFFQLAQQFKNEGLADIFIVGNEPNNENCTSSQEYAAAFNYLYGRKPAGMQLVTAGAGTYGWNSATNTNGQCYDKGGYHYLDWEAEMFAAVTAADGIALHSYGGYYDHGCSTNPGLSCSYGGWNFDAGFQAYRQQLARIPAKFRSKPVYLTEFNTDTEPNSPPHPSDQYLANWINDAYQEVRNYNRNRGANDPEIKAMTWFVGRSYGQWGNFALDNIPAACTDMKEEFRGGTPPTQPPGPTRTPTRTPTPPPSSNSAEILEGQSSLPASLTPGTPQQVTIRVRNSGNTTWTAGTLFRLGAYPYSVYPANQTTWSSGQCGGEYASPTNARIYLCNDVPPNGTHDFTFQVTAPTGSSGSIVLSVQMVQDGQGWFGEVQSWNIPISGGGCSTSDLPVPNDRWKLTIWNNKDLSGNPVEIRHDAVGSGGFNFEWGTGKASNCTGNDNYSIRFQRSANFGSAGNYTFTATSDDGVRVYVDGTQIIDAWYDQSPTAHTGQATLSAGWHTIQMDYYEATGGAHAELSWSLNGGGTVANLNITNPDSSIVPGLWLTQCFTNGQAHVWRIDTADTHWAQYQYDQAMSDCGQPDATFGVYPVRITANPGAITVGIWITWCTGVNQDRWVWQTNGSTDAPFKWPENGGASCP